jgi:ElaB/YqjD/DUF883 family membrane-anchored ribosome-binding protein
MGTVIRDIEQTHQTEPRLDEHVQTVKKDMEQLGRAVGERARRKLDDAREQGKDLYERVRTRSRRDMERRPLTWLAAAAGVGALAALVVFRK